MELSRTLEIHQRVEGHTLRESLVAAGGKRDRERARAPVNPSVSLGSTTYYFLLSKERQIHYKRTPHSLQDLHGGYKRLSGPRKLQQTFAFNSF
jgi:hypothetical protein